VGGDGGSIGFGGMGRMEAVILNGGRQQKALLHFFGCVLGGKGGLQLLTMLESCCFFFGD
jgi:hypothetical protein